ncbi:polysaccharide biosynthesis protein [[Eubacterium] siraeum]|nr:polysaccharide biosynthesis protein [[Eubacterium] siraeum]
MAVIITGGTGAIGSAMACAFAKTNDVAIIYKSSDEKARQLEYELGCKAYKADVTSAK